MAIEHVKEAINKASGKPMTRLTFIAMSFGADSGLYYRGGVMTIVRNTGLSRLTVMRAMDYLVKVGLVENLGKQGGRCHVYRLNLGE